jgi:hypothetical protein
MLMVVLVAAFGGLIIYSVATKPDMITHGLPQNAACAGERHYMQTCIADGKKYTCVIDIAKNTRSCAME